MIKTKHSLLKKLIIVGYVFYFFEFASVLPWIRWLFFKGAMNSIVMHYLMFYIIPIYGLLLVGFILTKLKQLKEIKYLYTLSISYIITSGIIFLIALLFIIIAAGDTFDPLHHY
jgi:hypothetical protein